jgi:hypothetical protein
MTDFEMKVSCLEVVILTIVTNPPQHSMVMVIGGSECFSIKGIICVGLNNVLNYLWKK